ncbi:UNVERIFIED_CONTAM: hypothetical protein GTU68_017872 [Idotea baltica]|nr:hypothetical protein [Idotea baltica]
MFDTMYDAPGRGLAAPQVGVMKRLFVIDVTWKEAQPSPVVFVNPRIVEASESRSDAEEACLSIPGMSAKIKRPRAVTVRYLDETGVITRRDFVGIEATSVQHQIDHLNGRLYFDRLSKVKRDMLLRKAKKLAG